MFPDGVENAFNHPKCQDVWPGEVLFDGLRMLIQNLGHDSGNVVA